MHEITKVEITGALAAVYFADAENDYGAMYSSNDTDDQLERNEAHELAYTLCRVTEYAMWQMNDEEADDYFHYIDLPDNAEYADKADIPLYLVSFYKKDTSTFAFEGVFLSEADARAAIAEMRAYLESRETLH